MPETALGAEEEEESCLQPHTGLYCPGRRAEGQNAWGRGWAGPTAQVPSPEPREVGRGAECLGQRLGWSHVCSGWVVSTGSQGWGGGAGADWRELRVARGLCPGQAEAGGQI